MTPFCFEHVFRAPSVDAVFAAYFDPSHTEEQDRATDIVERELIELEQTADHVRRVSRVVPRRQLPALVKPLTSGPLHYIESVTWKRSEDVIEIDIRPSLLRGRVQILGTYRLACEASGTVRRTYAGNVSVDIAVLSSRIERGIVAEIAKTIPIAAACTQDWIDRS
jgi:uncharacterized protein DUF2505